MLKTKLYFFNFLFLAFYLEGFASGPYDNFSGFHNQEINREINNFQGSFSSGISGSRSGLRSNMSGNRLNINDSHNFVLQNFNNPLNYFKLMHNDIKQKDVRISSEEAINYIKGWKDFCKKKEVKLDKFNKTAHIFFYFLLSTLLNVNNPDWRYYFFRGQLKKGGIFFYYGFFNFGIGFNRKIFWDTCSCRILGVNLFQFLGSFVLYFFVDQRETVKDRWGKHGFFSFFLFNDKYFEDYVNAISFGSKAPSYVRTGFFNDFVQYSFAVFPFLSFFTFDFQLFEYLTFSLNIGSFLFLTIAFFIYTSYKRIDCPCRLCFNLFSSFNCK